MATNDEIARLRHLNRQLISLLEYRGIEWQAELGGAIGNDSDGQPYAPDNKASPTKPPASAVHTATATAPTELALTTEHKISIFRSLLRGRTDVYPIRWENNAGRSGYSPACHNEWKSGVCGKPTIKCSQCSNQAWKSVTDQVIYGFIHR